MFERLRALIAKLDLKADRLLLSRIARLLFAPPDPQRIRHIVVYRVGNIGDTVVAIPAMAAIRKAFPDARITLLTSAGRDDLPGATLMLESFPKLADRCITYLPAEIKRVAGIKRLKKEIADAGPVDLFISLPVSLQTVSRGLREMVLARFLGARSAFGFELLLPAIFRSAYSRHYPERIVKTSDWLLSLIQKEFSLSLQRDTVCSFLQARTLDFTQYGLDPSRPILAVNAGAKLAIKRWPAESFQSVIRNALNENPNLQVVLLGSEGEKTLNEEIAGAGNGTVINLSGCLSLSETWALLSHVETVLSNDTGTAHMAGLLGKPTYVPYSGQFPAPLWHPPGETLISFRQAAPCAPCFLETCPIPGQPCLKDISPKEVMLKIASTGGKP